MCLETCEETFWNKIVPNLHLRVIVNLFQQLLDAEHLEDELISGELLEDVPLTEGGDHRAVEAFPWHVLQALTIGVNLGQISLSW